MLFLLLLLLLLLLFFFFLYIWRWVREGGGTLFVSFCQQVVGCSLVVVVVVVVVVVFTSVRLKLPPNASV